MTTSLSSSARAIAELETNISFDLMFKVRVKVIKVAHKNNILISG